MLWRAPWLRDRALLVVLAGLDALIILTVYSSVLSIRTGTTGLPGNGAIIASIGWVFISYILGRYSKDETSEDQQLERRSALSACGASAAMLTLFVLHSWAYQVVNAETRVRGFLVPTFLMVTVILALTGYATRRTRKGKDKQWLIVCTEEEESVIRSEATRDKIENLSFCRPEGAAKAMSRSPAVNVAVGGILRLKADEAYRFARVRANGKQICQVTDWCERELHRVPPELISSDWLIFSDGFAIQPGRVWWRIKRLGDVVLASALLIATSPVVAVAMLMIRIEERGPVFYKQMRTGIYGSKIIIWKLRSMKTNAEKSGARWAQRDDPRITKVGKILRKTRIDELPQLINVISGELSLIGPRPERPEIEEQLEELIPYYRAREWVRPGLSGWAQVSYPYGASVEDARMKLSYELYYLRNAGFFLDLLILLKTIKLVARAEGSAPESRSR